MNPTDPMKPVDGKREFWLHKDGTGRKDPDYQSVKPADHYMNEFIHTIDHSAFTEALDRIAILESRASQFESTVKETMRVRDEAISMLDTAVTCFQSQIPAFEIFEDAVERYEARAALKDLEDWVRG